MTDLFNWNTDASVVVRPQAAVAVTRGPDGEVLLRQEGQYCISEDQFIGVRPEHVVAICKAMLDAAGLHSLMIVPVNEIRLSGRDGNPMTIPASELAKLDRIAEEAWHEDRGLAWPRQAAPAKPPKDPCAATRQCREAANDSATVTPQSVSSAPGFQDGQESTVDVQPELHPLPASLLQRGAAADGA